MKRIFIILIVFLCAFSVTAMAQIVAEYSFEGVLGSKTPVRITFDVNPDGIAAGEIFYPNAKNPAPILIVGKKLDNSEYYSFREYQSDGVVTGFFNLELHGTEYADGPTSVEGEWTNPKTGNSLTMQKMRRVPVPRSFGNPLKPASPDKIGKKYSYQFWNQNQQSMMGGHVNFRAAGKNRVHFDVSNCPQNMAIGSSMQGRPAVLEGNHFIYMQVNECDYGFEAFFFDRFVVLRSVTGYETLNCFGAGTSFEDVYIKVID